MMTDAPQIQVDLDDLLARFAAENATYLRRAVMAETQVAALQQQVAIQRGMIESMRGSREQPPAEPGTA